MNFKTILYLGFIVFFGWSCHQNDRLDIQSFYFPLEDLKEGKVYEYRAVNNADLPPDYWHYKTIKEGKKTFFTGDYYDASLRVRQSFKEEKVLNGMLLEEIKLYYSDSLGLDQQIPVEILARNSYPFQVSEPSGIFLYKIKWQDPFDARSTTMLIRNRRYMGDTTYVYKGKKYDAIKMEIRELIEGHKEGEGYVEPEYSGLEIYAKELGLVYYRRDISTDFVMEYQLHDCYTIEALGK